MTISIPIESSLGSLPTPSPISTQEALDPISRIIDLEGPMLSEISQTGMILSEIPCNFTYLWYLKKANEQTEQNRPIDTEKRLVIVLGEVDGGMGNR